MDNNYAYIDIENIRNGKDMMSFDNYFICPENKMAVNLTDAVTLSSHEKSNLLFIYGRTGLGKTHLLKAIKQKTEERKPECKVIYITIKDFIREFISSIQLNQQDEFQKKYMLPDILLIDELDEIDKKYETQKELMHIINRLLINDKKIVISSCKSPLKILVDNRTIIRRMNSIIMKIDKPGYESRLAYLSYIIDNNFLPRNDDVLHFIAKKSITNFAVLGSILRSIYKTHELSGEEITIKSVKSLLKTYNIN